MHLHFILFNKIRQIKKNSKYNEKYNEINKLKP